MIPVNELLYNLEKVVKNKNEFWGVVNAANPDNIFYFRGKTDAYGNNPRVEDLANRIYLTINTKRLSADHISFYKRLCYHLAEALVEEFLKAKGL